MGLFDQYKTDAVKENDGVSVEFGTNTDGTVISFVLGRSGKSNKAYVKLLASTLKPYQRSIELKTADNGILETKLQEVFAGSVLKGWANVQDENGASIPFSKENAIALFQALPDLYEELNAKSNDISLFRVAALETETGN